MFSTLFHKISAPILILIALSPNAVYSSPVNQPIQTLQNTNHIQSQAKPVAQVSDSLFIGALRKSKQETEVALKSDTFTKIPEMQKDPSLFSDNNTISMKLGKFSKKKEGFPPKGKLITNTTFEDGKLPNRPYDSAFVARIKPQLLSENGNHFMRITSNYGDNSNTPATPKYKKRVRATTYLTETTGTHMPVLTADNNRQFYSVDIRFYDNFVKGLPVNSNFMEFFQHADAEQESYGKKNGIGPAARFHRDQNKHVYFDNNYNNETKQERIDLGYFPENEWHNFAVKAIWSPRPTEGLFEVYVDGKLKAVLKGNPSNLGPLSSRLPGVKFGLYGDNATGTIDVDNFINIKLPTAP